jgi:hypothetical protein
MAFSFRLKLAGLALLILTSLGASGAPFTPRGQDEPYGVGTTAWRFASTLPQEAAGVIELCYVEDGSAERILGRVDVRPFRSSSSEIPNLRILFSKAEVDGKPRVVLIVGYGIRSGTFVVEEPNLTSHSLAIAGSPAAGPSGEYSLVAYGDRVSITREGQFSGHKGRLFFRFIGKP